jgi:hypothetical protein
MRYRDWIAVALLLLLLALFSSLKGHAYIADSALIYVLALVLLALIIAIIIRFLRSTGEKEPEDHA